MKHSNWKSASKIICLLLTLAMAVSLLTACGVEGPAGPQGPQGEPGVQGPAGPAGKDAVIGGAEYTPSPDIVETLVTTNGTVTGSVDENGNLSTLGKFYTDYLTYEDAIKAGGELNQLIAEEGFVLLKNKDNALPLGPEEMDITLFGTRSVFMQTGGGGSGANKGSIPDKTLLESMEAAGFNVNKRLLQYYNDNPLSLQLWEGQMATAIPIELDPADYVSKYEDTFKLFGDAVLWTISRTGSEGTDLSMSHVASHDSVDEHYLQLDSNELKTFEYLKEQRAAGVFNKLIVIVNSANAMELGVLEDAEEVDGIIWIGHPGNTGIMALGRILNGEVSPSGRLSDIYSRDFKKDPSWNNALFNDHVYDENGERMNNKIYYVDAEGVLQDSGFVSIEFREGIYNGYKWYETIATDMNTKSAGSGDAWYEENVVYPFGYGLSYTTFEWKIDNVASQADITAANQTVTMRVWVKNTGNVAGKDVVQVYASQPYTDGGIEKASSVLIGFAKTELLQPGQSQVLEIQVVAQDLASYDYADKNNNGFKGYELEAGDYIISINKNSHEVVDSVTRTVKSTILCETDLISGNKIENLFSGGTTSTGVDLDKYNTVNASLAANMVTRAGGLSQDKQPKPSTLEERTITLAEYEAITANRAATSYYSYQDKESDPWYVASVPSNWTQSDVDTVYAGNTTTRVDGSKTKISIMDMVGIEYTEPTKDASGNLIAATDEGSKKWDEFMNQLTWEEMVNIHNNGMFYTAGIDAIGMEPATDLDGPAQLASGGQFWACEVVIASTFNLDLAEKQGQIIGNDSLFQGVSGWYGPAMNLHRNPFGGRNFEYYSEDPTHSGLFTAAVVKGATNKGVVTYIKHFALNEQESNRNPNGGYQCWVDEQTVREIYVKPFEYGVKLGHSMGLMTSVNRLGGITVTVNYALNESLLRGEWGFKGAQVTDWWISGYRPSNLMVRCGAEITLGNQQTEGVWDAAQNGVLVYGSEEDLNEGIQETLSPTHYYAVRKTAQRILYNAANRNNLDNCLNLAVFAEKTAEMAANSNTSVDISADKNELGANTVTYSTSDSRVTVSPAGVLTANLPAGTPDFDVVVTAAIDDYITTTFTVKVSVIGSELTYTAGTGFSSETYAVGNQVAQGAIESVSYSVVGGELPAGLKLNEDGTVSGRAQSGTYTVTVRCTYMATSSGWWGPTTTQGHYDQVFEIVVG